MVILLSLDGVTQIAIAVLMSGFIEAVTVKNIDMLIRISVFAFIGFLFLYLWGLLLMRVRTCFLMEINLRIKRIALERIVYAVDPVNDRLSFMTNDLKRLETNGIEQELNIISYI